jgi:hypothetical protein
MMSEGLRGLTGAKTDAAAWEALFRSFNARRGAGNLGYSQSSNKTIAIKINQNPANKLDKDYYSFNGVLENSNAITGNPHVLLALVKQLVNVAHVAPKDITICDPSSLLRGWGGPRTIGDSIYNYIHPLFPEVHFVDGAGKEGRELAIWPDQDSVVYPSNIPDSNDKKGRKIAAQILNAGYFINMAILKSHGDGPTLCAKNNIGSVSGPRGHKNLFGNNPKAPKYYSDLVPMMGNKDLGEKTLLFMIDAIYGCASANGTPTKWKKTFNDGWPSSIFMSQDGVAIDSVGFDFLNAEWGLPQDTDFYLYEAASLPAENGRKPSGLAYQPNEGSTQTLGSLGVFEHWNNPVAKQYSRNLSSSGSGIELFPVPASK